MNSHIFCFMMFLILMSGCGGASKSPLMEGELSADDLLITPIQEQPAVILELEVDVYRSPGGRWKDNTTYCLLAEGARIEVEGKWYYLGLEKSSEFNRGAPIFETSFKSRPFRINKVEPEVLPERLRNLHPTIEGYIRILRQDAPTTLSVPYLNEIRLLEWYYPSGKRVRLRGTLGEDSLFFRPKSLRYAD